MIFSILIYNNMNENIDVMINQMFFLMNLKESKDSSGAYLLDRFKNKINEVGIEVQDILLSKKNNILQTLNQRNKKLNNYISNLLEKDTNKKFNIENFKKFNQNLNKLEILGILGKLSLDGYEKKKYEKIVEEIIDTFNKNTEYIGSSLDIDKDQKGGGNNNLLENFNNYQKYIKYKNKLNQLIHHFDEFK